MKGTLEYLRECGRNYLRFVAKEPMGYCNQMLLCNHLDGFLPIEQRRIDNWEWIYCQVNGLLSLEQRLEREKLGNQAIREILESVEQICHSMEEYLLPFEGILLDPEYIYVPPTGRWECRWLYGVSESEGMAEKFAEYLLDHLDYENQQAVRLLYAVYQNCREGEGGNIELLRDSYRKEMGHGDKLEKEPERKSREKRQEPSPPVRQEQPKMGFFAKFQNQLKSFGGNKEKQKPGKEVYKRKEQNKEEYKKEKYKKEEYKKEEQSYETVEWKHIRRIEPEEKEQKETPGTALLTGGMMQGGIYSLRAKSMAYPDLLLTTYPFFIGKDEERMDGVVEDVYVSRYHARIDEEAGQLRLMDLGSTNGTFVNRERLQPYEARMLQKGDVLTFAHREYELCFLQ